MNTYYLGGTSMDLIKELNKERLEAEVTPVKVGDTVRVHVKVKEGSRERIQVFEAPSSPRSTAASPRPSPCAASPTVSVWRRSSPCTLPPSTRSRWSATVLCGVPSCTICAAAWARQPRSRRPCNPSARKERCNTAPFFVADGRRKPHEHTVVPRAYDQDPAEIEADLKNVDIVVEIIDARIPISSRNPDIDELGKNKARLILLNKSDLAEDKWNDAWSEYFREKGFSVVKVNSKKGGGIKSINGVIQEACKEKIERDRKRGILNRPVRAMVVGIPNVGKSTFINALAGKACAKTGNKPGVTKGKQWIRLNKNVELLDTPGILWPRFEDQAVGLKLAFIGSIKDEILQTEELAAELVTFMNKNYPGVLESKYNVEEDADPYGMIARIAESRHCLVRGNELDTEKASVLLMDDFRNGRLGRLTLEYPDAY